MRISLKWVLITGIIGLLVISVSIILASSFLTSQKVLLGHARNIMENIATFTINEAQHYLGPARDAAQLTEKLAYNDVVSSRQIEKLERYFYEQLRLHRNFAGIYIGFSNGEFFYVNRMSEKSPDGFRTKIISVENGNSGARLIWRDSNMVLIDEEPERTETFDPRQRPWYSAAAGARQTVWTDPYIFYTSQKPGLTVASPVYDNSGQLIAVVGVDIEIDELSRFLAQLKVGKQGKAFIVNSNGDLVAFPDLNKIRWPTGDSGADFRLTKINEIDDILAAKAFELLEKPIGSNFGKKYQFGAFAYEGRQYHTMFAPFTNPNLQWLIGIYLPEDDYLGSLKANRTQNIYIMLAIATVGSLIGYLIVRGIVRSMAALEKDSKAVEIYDLKTSYVKRSMIKEIQDAVDAFAQMKVGLAQYQQQNLELAEGLKERARDLHAKELQLRSTLTTLVNFSDALIVLDQAQSVRFLNPEAERLLKVNLEDILGRSFPYPVTPGQDSEIEIKAAERSHRIAEMRVVDTEWEGDKAFLVALRDITERQEMEKEIKWRAATLQYLHETALMLPSRETLTDLYEAIAGRVVNYIECKGVWIFAWSKKNERLRGELSYRLPPDIKGRQTPLTEGLVGQVITQGRTLLIQDCDASRFPGLLGSDETITFDQCIATPLVWGNRTLGVVVVGGDRQHPFSGEDIILLERFCPLAAAALDQKWLLAEAEGLYRRAEEDARTKSVLLKEINHRVKNNLTAIIGLLYAERRYSPARDKADFREALNGVIHQIQALATVHDLLSASDWQPLPLDQLVEKVIKGALQMLPRNKKIEVTVAPVSIRIIPSVAASLSMIVNECVTNTIKHAFQERDQCKLHVQIKVDEQHRKVHLNYRDDGPGYPESVIHSGRYNTGLHLLRNIVERELDGNLELMNNNGAVTRMTFPLTPSRYL